MDTDERLRQIRLRVTEGELNPPPLPEPLPTTGERAAGELVPDLSALAPEQWHAALSSVSRAAQGRATETLPGDVRPLAQTIVRYLPATPARRPPTHAIDDPVHRPVPRLPTPQGGRRQVNFRLSAVEHDRLVEAAHRLGMTPTALAKAFCLSGTNRALDPRGS